MSNVRTATFDLLRQLGMITMFGNPGSTEEPFLTDFPSDFRYILGLHEAAVVSMADGFAQASGNAAFVNLHTATGLGNGIGSLSTAWYNRAPLVVTAGQQTRKMLALEPWLVSLHATELPRPYVKWSHEPARPEDVPGAIERAYHVAMGPPPGPTFVSIPMDDWEAPASPRAVRTIVSTTLPDAAALVRVADALAKARNPVMIVGAGVARSGGWEAAVQLAERLRLPVWEAPAPERVSFPQDHPLFQGMLPLTIKALGDRLAGHDVVVVFGAAVFRYYPYAPGPFLPDGATLFHFTDDPDEATRAPVGDAIIGDLPTALTRLAEQLPQAERAGPARRAAPASAPESDPIQAAFVMRVLADAMPHGATLVEESASTRGALYDQLRMSEPASYFATASGGLGYAVPAAVGVGLARPDAPVCCVVGDGAAMFGIHAIWTAAHYRVPVVYIVLNNGGYGILKSFAAFQRTPGVPGLDLPGLDIPSIARGMGAEARHVTSAAALPGALREAFATAASLRRPFLLDVAIDATVHALFGDPSEE